MSFHQASCLKADFAEASLSHVNFTDANMKGALFVLADLTNVNFLNANLQRADLSIFEMRDTRFHDAFSVYATRFHIEHEILERNLVQNGQPHCNRSLTSDWKVEVGNILLRPQNGNDSNCRFVLESHRSGAIMSQRVSLTSVKQSRFYTNSKAIMKGNTGAAVLIQWIALDDRQQIIADTNISKSNISETATYFQQKLGMLVDTGYLNLYDHVAELAIVVHFYPVVDPSSDKSGSWCRNLELYIDYGPDLIAPLRSMYSTAC